MRKMTDAESLSLLADILLANAEQGLTSEGDFDSDNGYTLIIARDTKGNLVDIISLDFMVSELCLDTCKS